jgi:hypothetical protein
VKIFIKLNAEYGYGYDVFMIIVRFCFVTILTILGLWVPEGPKLSDYTKLSEEMAKKPTSYRSFSMLEVLPPSLLPSSHSLILSFSARILSFSPSLLSFSHSLLIN